MARRKKVTSENLKSIIADGIRNSAGYYGGELQRRREKGLEYYLGYPMGTEVEGRSKVISTDVMDAVESMLPSLLKAFIGSGDTVKFEPTGPEDEAQADQATDYCNFVFHKDNDGATLMHETFKDALLSGFGCFKTFWEEKESAATETYEDLSDEEVALLLSDPEVEAVEHTAEDEGGTSPVLGEVAPASHSIKIRRKSKVGRVVVGTVAPEDFFIDRRARFLDEATFVADRNRYTASDLSALGYSKKVIDSIPAFDEEDFSTEKLLREQIDDADFGGGHADHGAFDPSRKEFWLYDCYIRVDRNGDGISELVRCLAAGSGTYVILEEEEVEDFPYAPLVPIPMPHRFFGMSLADQLFEIQDTKTALWRNLLDNVYLQNNQRNEVVDGMVNMSDLLNSRPGGVVRVKQPGMIKPMVATPVGNHILEALEYSDHVKEVRTGVTKHSQGIDTDQLNAGNTATGVKMVLGMAQQRVEMIARLFAEGGVKKLFKDILRLISTHQDAPRMVRLRNSWVPMDPRNWKTSYDVSISVGLGNGTDEQRIMALTQYLNAQKEIGANMGFGPGSLVSRKNVYDALIDMGKEAGLDAARKYFTEPAPDGSDIPKPQPDPNQMFMQSQLKIEGDKVALQRDKMQIEHQQEMQKLEMESQTKQAEMELKLAEMQQRMAIEREKISAGMEKTAAQISADAEAGSAKLEVEASLARERLEHQSFERERERSSGIT